ncbi:hypothetical protein EU527_05650 [Candidatus Thorarchaeota archaeon]|nr:MAG: hypothetical protein EU527_05650 [Candidatus Thorarchaeota archaeon]
MNDINRIPDKRPILYELFCPICGGSLYALEEEPAYVGRPEVGLNPEGFTITKLECVLCRKKFEINGIGVKYEKSIADDLGWPFPVEIEDGPSVIPDRVKKRMLMRELDTDPIHQLIEDFYADTYNRSPFPLEKDVLYYVLIKRGKLMKHSNSLEKIAINDDEDSYNAQILGVDSKLGLERRWLPREICARDYLEGDIIESRKIHSNGSDVRIYHVVFGIQFYPIATRYNKS